MLAAGKQDTALSPSLIYWRNFTSKYLSARCLLTPVSADQIDQIEPLGADDSMALLLAAPPMHGAEYLTAAALHAIWAQLDDWICAQIQSFGSLGALLTKKAPQWHQLGRVCFHLAENKNDPDFPFAFMATYAPELSAQGKIRYQPLRQALQEYAAMQVYYKKVHFMLTDGAEERVQMLARLGYAEKIAPSPRWALATRLKT